MVSWATHLAFTVGGALAGLDSDAVETTLQDGTVEPFVVAALHAVTGSFRIRLSGNKFTSAGGVVREMEAALQGEGRLAQLREQVRGRGRSPHHVPSPLAVQHTSLLDTPLARRPARFAARRPARPLDSSLAAPLDSPLDTPLAATLASPPNAPRATRSTRPAPPHSPPHSPPRSPRHLTRRSPPCCCHPLTHLVPVSHSCVRTSASAGSIW